MKVCKLLTPKGYIGKGLIIYHVNLHNVFNYLVYFNHSLINITNYIIDCINDNTLLDDRKISTTIEKLTDDIHCAEWDELIKINDANRFIIVSDDI